MIKAIQFEKLDQFDHNDENDFMDIITDNCIILCEDVDIKRVVASKIMEICCGTYADNDLVGYEVNHDGEPKLTKNITYFPTSLLCIDNDQHIVCTIEASSILSAKNVEDIWFAIRNNNNKISIYPLRVFKGHKDDWDQGIEHIYLNVVNGRYSPYCYNKDFNPDNTIYKMNV